MSSAEYIENGRANQLAIADRNKPVRSPSTKRLIRQQCRQILDNPQATPTEKLGALQILERLTRNKDLAVARTRKSRSKSVASDKKRSVSDILRQVNAA